MYGVRGGGEVETGICHCGRSAESSSSSLFLLCSCLPYHILGGWSLDILCLPVLGQVSRPKLYFVGMQAGSRERTEAWTLSKPLYLLPAKEKTVSGHREAQEGGSKRSLNQISWWPSRSSVVWAAPPAPRHANQ